MKLEIELIPKTIWESNLRNLLPSSEWDKLRKEQYKKAGYRCEICSTETKLHCHERWKYDDKNHIQKLVGFIALCENCHMIKHAGFSMHTPQGKGLYNRNRLIEHFRKVNQCSNGDFLKYETEAFDKWEERSKIEWKQDFGLWSKLIKK